MSAGLQAFDRHFHVHSTPIETNGGSSGAVFHRIRGKQWEMDTTLIM
jgi:hypothetical protein